jgi:hypothetical protein
MECVFEKEVEMSKDKIEGSITVLEGLRLILLLLL